MAAIISSYISFQNENTLNKTLGKLQNTGFLGFAVLLLLCMINSSLVAQNVYYPADVNTPDISKYNYKDISEHTFMINPFSVGSSNSIKDNQAFMTSIYLAQAMACLMSDCDDFDDYFDESERTSNTGEMIFQLKNPLSPNDAKFIVEKFPYSNVGSFSANSPVPKPFEAYMIRPNDEVERPFVLIGTGNGNDPNIELTHMFGPMDFLMRGYGVVLYEATFTFRHALNLVPNIGMDGNDWEGGWFDQIELTIEEHTIADDRDEENRAIKDRFRWGQLGILVNVRLMRALGELVVGNASDWHLDVDNLYAHGFSAGSLTTLGLSVLNNVTDFKMEQFNEEGIPLTSVGDDWLDDWVIPQYDSEPSFTNVKIASFMGSGMRDWSTSSPTTAFNRHLNDENITKGFVFTHGINDFSFSIDFGLNNDGNKIIHRFINEKGPFSAMAELEENGLKYETQIICQAGHTTINKGRLGPDLSKYIEPIDFNNTPLNTEDDIDVLVSIDIGVADPTQYFNDDQPLSILTRQLFYYWQQLTDNFDFIAEIFADNLCEHSSRPKLENSISVNRVEDPDYNRGNENVDISFRGNMISLATGNHCVKSNNYDKECSSFKNKDIWFENPIPNEPWLEYEMVAGPLTTIIINEFPNEPPNEPINILSDDDEPLRHWEVAWSYTVEPSNQTDDVTVTPSETDPEKVGIRVVQMGSTPVSHIVLEAKIGIHGSVCKTIKRKIPVLNPDCDDPDNMPPIINCSGLETTITFPPDVGECAASNVVLELPEATDNCFVKDFIFEATDDPLLINSENPTFPIGTTEITWTAEDGAGNESATCTQNVTVEVDNCVDSDSDYDDFNKAKYQYLCLFEEGDRVNGFTTDEASSQPEIDPDLLDPCGHGPNGTPYTKPVYFQIKPCFTKAKFTLTPRYPEELEEAAICVYSFGLWEYSSQGEWKIHSKCMEEPSTEDQTVTYENDEFEEDKRYFLVVANAGATQGQFDISLSEVENERLIRAYTSTVDNVSSELFNTLKSDPDPNITNVDMENSETNYNVWFKFTTNSTPGENYRIKVKPKRDGAMAAISDYYVAAYKGSINNPTQIGGLYEAGNNESSLRLSNLPPDSIYYFSVDNGSSEGRGSFELEVVTDDGSDSVDINKDNNLAVNATLLPVSYNSVQLDGLAAFNNNSADADGPDVQLASDTISPNANVWFKFVAPTNGEIDVHLLTGTDDSINQPSYGNLQKPMLGLWNWNDNNNDSIFDVNELEGIDARAYLNATGLNKLKVGSPSLTPGKEYYISVDNDVSGSKGSFSLAIYDKASSDFAIGAHFLDNPFGHCLDQDHTNSDPMLGYLTTLNSSIDGPDLSCILTSDEINNNVWFKFKAPDNGEINAKLECGSGLGTLKQPYLALWSWVDSDSDNLMDAGEYTQLDCQHYYNDTAYNRLHVGADGLTPGTEYYVSVGNSGGGINRGNFTLCFRDDKCWGIEPSFDISLSQGFPTTEDSIVITIGGGGDLIEVTHSNDVKDTIDMDGAPENLYFGTETWVFEEEFDNRSRSYKVSFSEPGQHDICLSAQTRDGSCTHARCFDVEVQEVIDCPDSLVVRGLSYVPLAFGKVQNSTSYRIKLEDLYNTDEIAEICFRIKLPGEDASTCLTPSFKDDYIQFEYDMQNFPLADITMTYSISSINGLEQYFSGPLLEFGAFYPPNILTHDYAVLEGENTMNALYKDLKGDNYVSSSYFRIKNNYYYLFQQNAGNSSDATIVVNPTDFHNGPFEIVGKGIHPTETYIVTNQGDKIYNNYDMLVSCAETPNCDSLNASITGSSISYFNDSTDITIGGGAFGRILQNDLDVSGLIDFNNPPLALSGGWERKSVNGNGSVVYTAIFGPQDEGKNTFRLEVYNADGSCLDSINLDMCILSSGVTCQNQTIQLDSSGQASILASAVDSSFGDVCDVVSLALDIDSFNCADVGANTVTLTRTVSGSNATTCSATITVEDNIAPTIVTQEVTAYLDATGNVTIDPNDVENGSNDACGIDSFSLSRTDFSCSDLHNITELFISEYIEGTSHNKCIEIYNGTGSDIDLSQDSFAIEIYYNGDSFPTPQSTTYLSGILKNGEVHVLCNSSADPAFLAASDQLNGQLLFNGNDAIALKKNGAFIDIIGTIGHDPETAWTSGAHTTLNTTLVRNSYVPEGNITNNYYILYGFEFGFTNLESEWLPFPQDEISNLGSHVAHGGLNYVVMTATDIHGNQSARLVKVIIEDTILPTAICQNITVELDASGSAIISPNDIDNGSFDACGVNLTIDQDSFTCADIGVNVVTLTAIDSFGNQSSCTSNVTVEDNRTLQAICKDITLQLDATGNASITVSDVDNGSTGYCDTSGLSLDRTTFSCDDLGESGNLYISEYIEGSSYNKCIEIFNGAGDSVDLSAGNYAIKIYYNGNTTPNANISLTGTVASGDVYIVCHSSASSSFTNEADQTTGSLSFNGDDAVALFRGSDTLDIFGVIGEDPGSKWSVNGNESQNKTLVRDSTVTEGNIDTTSGFPSLGTEWTEYAQNTSSYLGSHNGSTSSSAAITVTLTVTNASGDTSTCVSTVTVEDQINYDCSSGSSARMSTEPNDQEDESETKSEVNLDLAEKNKKSTIRNLSVYPNPTNGKLFFEYWLEEDGDVSLEIYSIDGKSIVNNLLHLDVERGKHKLIIETQAFPKGIYFYKLTFDNERKNGKFVVE